MHRKLFRRGFAIMYLAASFLVAAAENPPRTRLAEVETVQPLNYRADLALDPEKNTFSGTIVIRMDIGKPLRTLWLNQEKIQIRAATLERGGKTLHPSVIPGGEDYVGLQFDSAQPAGPAVLTIDYNGVVVEKNSSAIFRQQESGNWYIFSQFEPTDARGAFPCFDEPSYKTPWQLTLRIPERYSAISNTPAGSEKTVGGSKTVVFKETKPLPSYLVAFAVGPFEFVDAGTVGKNRVPVRIVVPKGKAAQAKYAAEVTATILNRHEEYFGIPYPYEKADQVAVPNTAGWGAMENPGMVTYEQNLILADPKLDTIARQRQYALVAAHELAHQWFGDLVTTAWWDDIWLNEAFATWMEGKLLSEWKPDWQTNLSEVAEKLRVEDEDSLISARRIRQPILARDDINNAFDGITYQKGAAVIGMFESWMGPEEFRKGVQSYLRQYAFRATTAGDFLDSLSSASGKDVTGAFSTFLNQAGVPLISVALDCQGNKAALHLRQERFLPAGSKGSADRLWSIPVCVRYGRGVTGKSQCTLMTQASETLALEGGGCPAWVQANDRAVGYYRVNYDGGLLGALTAGDADRRLPANERVDLMGNAQALADAGKLSAGQSLALVETFHADPERYVTQAAIRLALAPRASLVPEDLMANYRRFLLKNFGERARELGWVAKPGETENSLLLRPEIIRPVATWGGDKELASQGKALAEKWLRDPGAVDQNMVEAALGTAAFYGGEPLFRRYLDEFRKTRDKQVRRNLLRAMNAFRDPATVRAGMTALIAGDIPFIEGARLLFNGQEEAATRKLSLEFLKAHWDEVVAKMPTGGGFDFGSVLPRAGESYCDVGSRDELRSFFAPRIDKFVGAPRALNQIVEAIDLCIARKSAQGPGVAEFLSRY